MMDNKKARGETKNTLKVNTSQRDKLDNSRENSE